MVGLLTGCNKDSYNETDVLTIQLNSNLKSQKIKPEVGGLKGVNLGVAGNFVILSKTGVTDVYPSVVVGVGTSPITGAAMLLKCDEATGAIWEYYFLFFISTNSFMCEKCNSSLKLCNDFKENSAHIYGEIDYEFN